MAQEKELLDAAEMAKLWKRLPFRHRETLTVALLNGKTAQLNCTGKQFSFSMDPIVLAEFRGSPKQITRLERSWNKLQKELYETATPVQKKAIDTANAAGYTQIVRLKDGTTFTFVPPATQEARDELHQNNIKNALVTQKKYYEKLPEGIRKKIDAANASGKAFPVKYKNGQVITFMTEEMLAQKADADRAALQQGVAQNVSQAHSANLSASGQQQVNVSNVIEGETPPVSQAVRS